MHSHPKVLKNAQSFFARLSTHVFTGRCKVDPMPAGSGMNNENMSEAMSCARGWMHEPGRSMVPFLRSSSLLALQILAVLLVRPRADNKHLMISPHCSGTKRAFGRNCDRATFSVKWDPSVPRDAGKLVLRTNSFAPQLECISTTCGEVVSFDPANSVSSLVDVLQRSNLEPLRCP